MAARPKAGLHPTRRDERGRLILGDVITALDGQPVHSSADLLLLLEQREGGETVRITTTRDGRTREVTVKLQRPDAA